MSVIISAVGILASRLLVHARFNEGPFVTCLIYMAHIRIRLKSSIEHPAALIVK